MSWVAQRVVDGQFYNGFRRASWSKSISAALAFHSKAEAVYEITDRGWQGVVYLPLPKVRRSPREFAKLRPS